MSREDRSNGSGDDGSSSSGVSRSSTGLGIYNRKRQESEVHTGSPNFDEKRLDAHFRSLSEPDKSRRTGNKGGNFWYDKEGKRRKYDIQGMKYLAEMKNGKCLSTEYKGVASPLQWECKDGHIWITKPYNILYDNNWCPFCARERLGRLHSKEVVISFLKEKGWDLLDEYIGYEKKLKLQHRCGDIQYISFRSIQKAKGTLCLKCDNKLHLTQEAAEAYTKPRGGKLLFWGGPIASRSTWECKEGHIWNASWKRIYRDNSWCPECNNKNKFGYTQGRNGRIYPKQEDSMRLAKKTWHGYKRYDLLKSLAFDLSIEDVVKAKGSPCIYCGRQASGFDRIDNALGHTKTNCVPCCVRCNWTRGSHLAYEVMLKVGMLLKEIDP